jgi:hypothetical protein
MLKGNLRFAKSRHSGAQADEKAQQTIGMRAS